MIASELMEYVALEWFIIFITKQCQNVVRNSEKEEGRGNRLVRLPYYTSTPGDTYISK